MTTSNAAIRAKSIVINVFKYVLLIFSAFVALVPIVSCINTAFKTEEEYAATHGVTDRLAGMDTQRGPGTGV